VPRLLPSRKPWISACIVLPLLAATPFAWLTLTTERRRTSVDRAEPRPVALVLGAGLRSDGRPTGLLARRLDLAAELYRRGTVQAVLASGARIVDSNERGSRNGVYDEPAAMRAHLIATGVPAAKIVSDPAGFRTWDSCIRAHDVFGVRAAVVVTQNFHLPRAVALCRAADIDAIGVGDPSLQARRLSTVYGYLREVPAAVKAVTDLLRRPAPRRVDPAQPDITAALDAPR
jgi:vancomycin permeability regulator SanA